MADSSAHILIVDDEEGIRDLLRDEFEMQGCKVSLASNGREAFEMVKTASYDAILSDIRMPGGDGLTLFKDVQQLPQRQPPFFLMSGFSDMSRDQAIAQGAKDLFPKPFDLDTIFATVMAQIRS